jgi:uncharacterized membrane protein YeaQ/YmgE (transglycosylase-associated protein family)
MMWSLIGYIIIGGIAGWIAGKITRGSGFGLLGNIVVGIAGAIVGGFLFKILGIMISSTLLGSLITATAGAIFALVTLRLLRGK